MVTESEIIIAAQKRCKSVNFIMMEVTGKGRACIPGGLTKASRWFKST